MVEIVAGLRWARLLVCLLVCTLSLGCLSRRAQLPGDEFLLPLARRAAVQPSEADYASRDLIRAALLDQHEEVEEELDDLEEIAEGDGDQARTAKNRLALSTDLANTTVDDPDDYRTGCRKLKRKWKLNPRLRQRLKECVNDDSLKLARRRVLDVWESLWADTYNAIAEPLGRSVLTGGSLTPYYIASAVAHYLAQINERDPFPVQLRQALAHRKNYLMRNPDSPKAPKVKSQVAKAQRKFDRVESRRMAHEADKALGIGKIRYAIDLSSRARLRNPNNKRAARVHADAVEALHAERELRLRSQGVVASPDRFSDPEHEALAIALLVPDGKLRREVRNLLQSTSDAELEDTARFVLAMEQYEDGHENSSWQLLARIASQGPEDSTMARHAWTLLNDPMQNPYGSFVATRSHQTAQTVRWYLLSNYYYGPRYRRLWRPAAWLLDLPAAAQTLATAPLRLIVGATGGSGAKAPDFQKVTASAAYRYLERRPDGERMREVASWLLKYEEKHKNWNAALRMADLLPDVGVKDRTRFVEKSAEQQIAAAASTRTRDRRSSILRNTAQEFPESMAGHVAGVKVRELLLNATEQRIRLTKGFLQENPEIAGPDALGIRPELLDDENRNAELHPRGVTFLGGRTLEFAFVNTSGKENDPPIEKRRKISEERLARVVAELDWATRHNMRIDDGDEVRPDPRRDHYFERARLGVSERPDRRATAQSTYVYKSMRERYGMVRGRDSILPFDIVVQGSLSNMGIAAFPRWRKPRETPDAFLYR